MVTRKISLSGLLAMGLLWLCATPGWSSAASCSNEPLRAGASAGLPDCRAYELVTPPDTNGRMLEVISHFTLGSAYDLFPAELASPVRDSFVYTTYAGALDSPSGGSGAFDMYEAERTDGAWETTHHLSHPASGQVWPLLGGISADHTYSFQDEGPDASYLRSSVGSFEFIGIGRLGNEPHAQGRYISEGGEHVIFSTGDQVGQSAWCAGCPVLQLESNAAPTGTGAVYDREADGETRVVSLLPGDIPLGAGEEAFYKGTAKDGSTTAFEVEGTLYVRLDNQETKEVAPGSPIFAGISADGDFVFYVIPGGSGEAGAIHRFHTATGLDEALPGEALIVNISGDGSHVYFVSREALTGSTENGQGEVARLPATGAGDLSAAKGTGVLSSGSPLVTGVTTSEGTFAVGMQISGQGIPAETTITAVGPGTLTLSSAVTDSGTRDLTAGSTLVTGVTTSEGTFLEGMEISGDGIPNGTTIAAIGSDTLTLSRAATQSGSRTFSAGFPNLYVWSNGSLDYITTVAPSDLEQTSGELPNLPALTNWTDGVFNPPPGREPGPGADSSRSTPDGRVLVFESRAQLTSYENAGHTEIYRYDDGTKELRCASCNPLEEPAEEDARLQELHLVGPQMLIHNVSDDGNQIFFETSEALVSHDTNAGNDVYRWRGDGEDVALALISSGESPEYPLPDGWESPFAPLANLLLSVTPDGSDVFFTAKEPLAPGAGEAGTQAIYDARVEGGFPVPVPPVNCTEEQCRPSSPSSSPPILAPGTESLAGSGNVKPRKHRCRANRQAKKHRKHHRCRRHQKKKAAQSSAPTPVRRETAMSEEEITDNTPSTQSEIPASQAESSPRALAVAQGEDELFAIERVEADSSTLDAGAHPDFTTLFEFTHFEQGGQETASASAENIWVSLPPGFTGLPSATPTCSMGDFVSFGHCSADSQVGITRVKVGKPLYTTAVEPVYNLALPHPNEEIARFGFIGFLYPVFIDIKVRTASDYGVTAIVRSAPGLGALIRAKTTLWGDPSSSDHDAERLTPLEAARGCGGTPCEAENEGKQDGERASTIPLAEHKAFMTNPAACQGGQVGLEVSTYQHPREILTASAPVDPIVNCTGLPFAPTFSAEPTSNAAGAPTGLNTRLVLPQHLRPNERATATMREARVTLPAGMQIAAGAANWIGTCSDDQVGYHREVDTACPDTSKLGTATISSPALPEPIEGAIYQRTPTPGHQFGLWLTADALGLHIKLPGELEPDKSTGRLTAVFRDLPQVPVEAIELDVWGGARAPLQNPDRCGTYTTDFSFAPHSDDPAASGQSQMTIDQGCNQGFSPTLHAGATNPTAGAFSPFVFDLTHEDGQQALRGFELHLPDGELAKLAGVPLCSDDAAGAGSCPAGSRIGSLKATTGPGPDPLHIPQPGKAEPQIYLAGPYQGAPFSIVSEVPAQAGPFDLGTLAVRSGLDVDSETARATVKADPLPQFFEGVGIAYRRLHAVIDRPDFSLNPTDCREMAVTAEATSTLGAVAHPAARFQVDGCKALKFKPRLSLKLRGGTKRAAYPALTAVLKARVGDANIARTSVALPHSEFLAQEHIQTICTRVQFAAESCPKGSIYGKAKAWTPLLDRPLEGPVYLRSSNHPLPDMVAAMDGQLEIDLVGRIDSKNGGIRTTFDAVPDAPVSKFVLQMKGGAKGLLTNSTDICQGTNKATVKMRAQNGRVRNSRSRLASTGCGKSARKNKPHR
jgi:hypothetical protein